jgi:hypothetical protein
MSNYLPAFMLPVTITSSNNSIHINNDGTHRTVTITAGEYVDQLAVIAALETAIDAVLTAGDDVDITINSTGKIVFVATGMAAFGILWTDGASTIDAVLGFNSAADDTGATTYTADYLAPNCFFPEFPLEDDSWERVDRSDDPAPTITQAGYAKRVTNPNDLVERVVTINHVVASRFHVDGGATGTLNTFCEWWAQATQGDAVRFYPHTDTWAGVKTYTLTAPVDTIRDIRRVDAGATYYGPITLTLKERTV